MSVCPFLSPHTLLHSQSLSHPHPHPHPHTHKRAQTNTQTDTHTGTRTDIHSHTPSLFALLECAATFFTLLKSLTTKRLPPAMLERAATAMPRRCAAPALTAVRVAANRVTRLRSIFTFTSTSKPSSSSSSSSPSWWFWPLVAAFLALGKSGRNCCKLSCDVR